LGIRQRLDHVLGLPQGLTDCRSPIDHLRVLEDVREVLLGEPYRHSLNVMQRSHAPLRKILTDAT